MTLPTGVQDMLNSAQAMLQQNNAPTPAPSPIPIEADTTRVVDMQTPQPKPQLQLQVPPVITPPPQPVLPTDLAALRQENDQLKHANAVLTGKYNSEVPRLQQRVRELTAENEVLRRLQVQAQAPAQAVVQKPAVVEITDEDVRRAFPKDIIDEDGIERCKAYLRAGRQVQVPANSQNEVEQLRMQLAADREERFFRELGALVPDYEAVNANPNFLAWLDSIDPISGLSYQDCLSQAQHGCNAVRASHILNTWKASVAAIAPATKPSLNSQVVPHGQPPTLSTQAKGPTYTIMEWQNQMSLAMGLPEAERVARLNELQAAYKEGRIQQPNGSASGYT